MSIRNCPRPKYRSGSAVIAASGSQTIRFNYDMPDASYQIVSVDFKGTDGIWVEIEKDEPTKSVSGLTWVFPSAGTFFYTVIDTL